MSSKLRVKLPERHRVFKGAQLNRDKKVDNQSNAHLGKRPLENVSMQHAYGNKALQRIAHSMQVERLCSQMIKGLHSPYDQLAHQLGMQMQQLAKSDLFAMFEGLTKAQKISVLRSALGTEAISQGVIKGEVDWEKLESSIDSVQGVELRKDEPEVEADVTESGAVTAVGNVDVTGFLAPYKDLIRWLNYKANKQGKAHVMQEFDALSIPQKKIAIHKINQWRKLRFDTFTESLSVDILLRKWVDWDIVLSAVRSAKRLKIEQISDDVLEKLTSHDIPKEANDFDEEHVQEDDDGMNWLGLLGAAMAMSGNTQKDGHPKSGMNEQRDLKQMMDDPSEMSWLLLGMRGAVHTAAVVLTFYMNRKNKTELVDRFLNVQDSSPEKAREQARKQQLQKQGFKSIDDCYAHIMNELAALIFEKGIVAKDNTFANVLQSMGLSSQTDPSTAKAMIEKKLNLL